MPTAASLITFEAPDIGAILERLAPEELDELAFGVIGFDASTTVVRYNAPESRLAGLRPAAVLGNPLFEVVAPCMNNFMVSHRFQDAAAQGTPLDAIVDYVLTLKMRPQKVRLRLVSGPDLETRYVLVSRRG